MVGGEDFQQCAEPVRPHHACPCPCRAGRPSTMSGTVVADRLRDREDVHSVNESLSGEPRWPLVPKLTSCAGLARSRRRSWYRALSGRPDRPAVPWAPACRRGGTIGSLLYRTRAHSLPPLQGEGRGGDGSKARDCDPIPLLTSPLKGEEHLVGRIPRIALNPPDTASRSRSASRTRRSCGRWRTCRSLPHSESPCAPSARLPLQLLNRRWVGIEVRLEVRQMHVVIAERQQRGPQQAEDAGVRSG